MKKDVNINGVNFHIDNNKNWGDLIPFLIIKFLSRSNKITYNQVYNINNRSQHTILSTGSVFNYSLPTSIVWGTGCIDKEKIGDNPKKIYSVRGPLTRQLLLDKGFECPEIYGDPALFFPIIYNPTPRIITHKIGFVPHYIEFENQKHIKLISKLNKLGIKIINPCAGEYKFIDELLSVEKVISSSLHGLIAADAYNIPNAKVNLSNNLIGG